MKILLIDDDVDLLDMTARRINRKGAQTLCASNLTEAQKILNDNKDLVGIVCDLFLQDGENGILFYEQYIRGKFAGKFILATGDDSIDSKIAEFKKEDKLFHNVEKPYSIEEVLNFINA